MKPVFVLLVDDDLSLLQALPETLIPRIPRIVVDAVSSSRTALARLRAKPYDTLVTDLEMPDMDGFALLQAARSAHPGLPIVIMTGRADPSVALQMFDGGAYDFIAKPFDRHEFATVVRLALQAGRLRRDVKAQQFLLARFTARLTACEPIGENKAQVHLDALCPSELSPHPVLSPHVPRAVLTTRARLLTAMLARTEARLGAVQEEARCRALVRLRDGEGGMSFLV